MLSQAERRVRTKFLKYARRESHTIALGQGTYAKQHLNLVTLILSMTKNGIFTLGQQAGLVLRANDSLYKGANLLTHFLV